MAPESTSADHPPPNVLIVDDDSAVRLLAGAAIGKLGYWEFDPGCGKLLCSDQMSHIFGLQPRERVSIDELLACVHPQDEDKLRRTLETVVAGTAPELVHYRIRRSDGAVRHLCQQAEMLPAVHGEGMRVVATVQDITDREEAEAKIRFLAYRDVLTGLPNRKLFHERLERTLARSRRSGHHAAVLHVDVDRFKAINEGFGHAVGDELLREVATRLETCLRISDTVARGNAPARPTLSRCGGDEFIIALQDLSSEAEAAHVAERIVSELGLPYGLSEAEILVSVSIGIAVCPEDGDQAEALVRRAETALAHAKRQGGNGFLFYSGRMNTHSALRLELASKLHHGIEKEQFQLVYQPIFDSVSQRIRSVEALLRWNDPERGIVVPEDFIPVAEETGLILPLGGWVIDQACAQWRRWVDEGLGPVEIAVNVSARQFRDRSLVQQAERSILHHDVDPSYLRFELTEGTLMSSASLTHEIISSLHDLGIGLAIDDFGTGYSSLSHLRRFPGEVLKIDRSFIDGIPEDQENCSLVAAIVAMAHKLRMRVVAVGVETEVQLRFLCALDCEQVQGFLLALPASSEQITDMLRKRLDHRDRPTVLPFRRRAS